MLNVKLNSKKCLAILSPDGKLNKQDFQLASNLIDPFIEEHGSLNGLVIYSKNFPGWANFSALIAHFNFIHDHHKKVKRLAFVSDSSLLKHIEPIAKHFVMAEIKEFNYQALQSAIDWATESAE
ncbi:MAG: STAS/SEC14 domain-containing protein [Proteobacteria bacterium]|nr:STAS/SEC14 domain-containing protein [Pseudomonadota bacterium]